MTISESRFRMLVEAIPVGLLITSTDGVVEAANPHSLILFKCDYSDLVRRQVSNLFSLAHGQDLFDEEAMLGGFNAKEVTATRPSGSSFPAELIVRPFSTPTASQLLMIVTDITERLAIERMKKEFVSMISHDLRTPLTSIQCFLNLIAEGQFNEMQPLQKNARMIESEATRLINMINNLLNIDRIESGGLEMFIDAVPLSEIIESSLVAVVSLAQNRGITFQQELPGEEVYLLVDREFAIQVLVNLLSNALKFSPQGVAVTIRAEATSSHVKVSVVDQGPGIATEFRQRIFQRFEQATIADARVKGGSGLGLAISKSIVEQQGGTIGFDSEEGMGTTFWFTLKRVDV